MNNLTVTTQSIEHLLAYSANARTHSKSQIKKIAESITEFGFTSPVLVDKKSTVIAGHGRLEAAKLLDIKKVPTICLDDLTSEQVRAYRIADNRLAELAEWDSALLSIEFQQLDALELDFDLSVTGFDTPEIDLLIGGDDEGRLEEDDDVHPPADGPSTTRIGDLWRIGEHRLICGDATDRRTYERLLDGATAQMVFTDPPYNVPVDGHVSGKGKHKHREFAMASGEMSETAFTTFLTNVFFHLAAASDDGAVHFICMDWRHMAEVLAAGRDAYTDLKNLCVWAKTNGGMGSLYRSQHELIFVFKSGDGPHINNVELGRYGRNRTNIWTYPGANSFGKTRDADLALHPTVKPVSLVADAILDCSNRKGVILDAFAGSGTTLLAAHQTGRRGYGVELDPLYCDVILRRLQTAAGTDAVNMETGETFAECAAARAEADNG
ncbi:MAG: DNA methyltransferase [Pseudomonadota bacterium]